MTYHYITDSHDNKIIDKRQKTQFAVRKPGDLREKGKGIVIITARSKDLLQYKDHLYRHKDSHNKEYIAIRPSYLYFGNSYTDETAILY